MDDSRQTDTTGHMRWTIFPDIGRSPLYARLGDHGILAVLQAPQFVKVEARLDDDDEIAAVSLEAALVEGRYRVMRVEVRGRETGVTSETLRRVPVAAILTKAVAHQVHKVGWLNEAGEDEDWVWQNPLDNPDTALDIVYLTARACAAPPTLAVADFFEISRSAAAQRVARRRKAGFLPATTPGKVS